MYQKRNNRKRQAEITKNTIYTRAREMFRQRGFDNVTIEEIAEAAGVSVGTIYYYFKSKQEIMANYHTELDTAYEAYYRDMLRAAPRQNAVKQLYEIIRFICRVSAEQGIENIRIVYPYMLCNAEFGSRMVEPERPYYRIIMEIITNGQQRGELKDDVPAEQMVQDVTMLVRGCITEWCIQGGAQEIGSLCDHMLRTYLSGLARN